jgi:2-polyprenyl-3-methyl-5-hydroxy-6-metoxy-1,4-benzoquinol methylase
MDCPFCGSTRFSTVFVYEAPPRGEVRFEFSGYSRYHREVLQCEGCGHFQSLHAMDTTGFYEQQYVSTTYGAEGLRRAFDRITALDPAKSDNVGRVRRILEFARGSLTVRHGEGRPPTVLDVGSGLCVFLHRMKEAGWCCTALDPDERAAMHAREVVGVEALCGDFLSANGLGHFDVITFNKVLEHVREPVAMLAKSASHLNKGGFVYVELPDGEMAVQDGPEREEFFIEHHHVFSLASVALLASRAGFVARLIERLREPSFKDTVRAFLVPK